MYYKKYGELPRIPDSDSTLKSNDYEDKLLAHELNSVFNNASSSSKNENTNDDVLTSAKIKLEADSMVKCEPMSKDLNSSEANDVKLSQKSASTNEYADAAADGDNELSDANSDYQDYDQEMTEDTGDIKIKHGNILDHSFKILLGIT